MDRFRKDALLVGRAVNFAGARWILYAATLVFAALDVIELRWINRPGTPLHIAGAGWLTLAGFLCGAVVMKKTGGRRFVFLSTLPVRLNNLTAVQFREAFRICLGCAAWSAFVYIVALQWTGLLVVAMNFPWMLFWAGVAISSMTSPEMRRNNIWMGDLSMPAAIGWILLLYIVAAVWCAACVGTASQVLVNPLWYAACGGIAAVMTGIFLATRRRFRRKAYAALWNLSPSQRLGISGIPME